MRSPSVLVLLAAAALAPAAIATTAKPAPAKPAAVSTPAKAVNAPASPEAQKRAACERTWKAQTKHTGKHKAFIAACVAKG